jgi:ATP-dependent DNA helicase RecQ
MNNLSTLLQQNFGFDSFRSGQREVMEALLDEGRALAIFPTGAGKSLCYQLPALALDGVTIVVSPLIALMKDQIDFLQSRGIAASRLDSSLDASQTREVNRQLRSGELKLLYVAPERFNNERFLETLRNANIALLAVDEAHCISEWGHNFRPDYLKLAQFSRDLDVPRVLALTATATPEVAASICDGFGISQNAAINTGFYRPNLNLQLTPVEAHKREGVLAQRLQSRPRGATIVYVTLQKTAERLAQLLSTRGLEARAYHAGLESQMRHEIQEWWMESDARIVVATIAFGMGIDKSDVRFIYHFNLPKGLESYSQEIGRAGRDGANSIVELLAARDDVSTLENFAYGDTPTPESLRALTEYLLGLGEEFSIKEYDISQRFDVRSLVLRTVLTYLELGGVLRQGTPYYAGYEVRPLGDLETIYSAFGDKAAQFLRELFFVAKKGRVWWKFDPDEASEKLQSPRKNIVRAMELLEEKNVAEVRAADARQRYHRLNEHENLDAIVDDLIEKFARRESNEIKRIQDVLQLVEHDGCQTNALVGYFGEARSTPCGHCSWCERGPATLPPARELPPIENAIDVGEVRALQNAQPTALGQPRQLARFLCGLSSPAQSKARIGRNPLFGKLEAYLFGEVLAWCEELPLK